MKIHEYQAKSLFKSTGIPVPSGQVAHSPEEAKQIAQDFGTAVAVKAQVHAGGRGKAGGIKLASSPEEAQTHAQAILGMDIKGCMVRKVLVEQASNISEEAYLGMIIDRADQCVGFIASAEGGVDIEEVAASTPEKILRFGTKDTSFFPEDEARIAASALFAGQGVEAILDVMRKLFSLFVEKDCSLAEINPLVLTQKGEVIALDGKINFDDNALFRQSDIVALRDMDEEDANEIKASASGLSFVALDGDIGCMVNGAGLAMATMDMIKHFGGEPANFLDVGGSSNPDKVVEAFRIIMSNPDVKAVLINIYGGINRCDDIAKGILTSLEQIEIEVPIVVRLSGTNAEQGLALLEGTSLITAKTFSGAVKRVLEVAHGVVA